MRSNQHRSHRSRTVAGLLALLAVLGLGWTTSAQAQGSTQCSGSIILSPDKGQVSPTDVLESGEALTIGVAIFNTSQVAGVNAAASVRGTTDIILSCATEFPCVSELAALTFDSCTPAAGIASCALDPMNSNHVLITYTGNNKALAAGTSTNLATLNVHAEPGQHILSPTDGGFFVTGTTGSGNIFIGTTCAGSGQGSAPLFYPGICGDGFTDTELGEECDDGNTTPFDGCGIPGGGANNCLICPDSTPCPDTDNNECSTAGCNATGFCDQLHTLPNSTPCTDTGNECAAAGCNGAGQCDQLHVPAQDSSPCTDNDGNVCTEAGCQAGQCDQNHVLPNSKPCTDTGNECAAAGCNGLGVCDQLHTPVQDSTPCTDTDDNTCTEAGCEAGLCDQRHVLPDSKPCPDTTNECAEAGCDGTGICDQNHVLDPDGTPCTDTDQTQCTDPTCIAGQCDQDGGGIHTCGPELPDVCCDPEDGICKPDPTLDPSCAPTEAICRTPGFWGTHGGSEKDGPNVTQAVIDHAGCLEVCGEIITNTAKDDAESALEAICIKVKGQQTLQLARQLTSMALNCVISGFGANCAGDAALAELFSRCNAACVSGDIGDCIGEVDAFNNGIGLAPGCHDRQLCNEDIGLCFQKTGPASSPKACNGARGNSCTIIAPGEEKCGTGTIEDDPEHCPCTDTFVCGGPTAPFACGGADCLAVDTTEDTCFCGADFTCGSTPACTTSADCPAGSACQAAGSGCCGAGVCIPPCTGGAVAASASSEGTSNSGQ